MDILFLAFANDPSHPLPSLKEEDDKVYSLLARRALQQHFAIHRDSSTSIPKIAEYLVLFRDYLTVFLFSGHAGRDALLLEQQEAGATGIAGLLGQCPRLKLVILNGCSTQGQVKRLLALDNHPVVIATHAPVGDRAATQFSISFFQAFSEQHLPIAEAFEAALSAAQTETTHGQLPVTRGFQLPESASDTAVWGLFSATPSTLAWTLPLTPHPALTADYQPNAYLVSRLVEALAPHNEDLARIREDEATGIEHNILDKREAILRSLPHPISEQLRKLLVPEQTDTPLVFYDKPGIDRLRQMVATYHTAMELVTFIVLAQLWDVLTEKPSLKLSEELTREIADFFRLRIEEKTAYNHLPLIRAVLSTLSANHIPFFVRELTDAESIFQPEATFCSACRALDAIQKKLARREGLEPGEAQQFCIIAEEKTADLLGKLGFFARYTLASVKDIDVIKFRHLPAPRFKHKLVNLIQRFVGLAEEQQVLDRYLDNASVLFMEPSIQQPDLRYLNLSPFLIDENAFDERAGLAKLYVFDHYEKESDSFFFKHIYKPEDEPLLIRQQPNLRPVKAQLEAFAQLIFHHPLQELS